ncbi:MAG: hypothetical protein PUK26_00470 [Lachnoclostridium sp.]|nr:hypothetical protein [Lachnoclostridium sp.]
MMNRLLDPKNPKDKFIIETLLPYLVDHIEESEFKRETADQISSMYVFPYRTSEGTKLGSLKEPGISWYFDKNKEKKTVSSGGYRIIDDSVLSEKNAANFRKTFNEYCGISEFSDHAVIKDLLEKMSMETDYTNRWWTYAYDVFTLWRKEDFNSSLEMATEGMQNDRFLFIEGEYSDSLKQRLLKYGVFSDIRETSFKTCFWNLIKNRGDEKKAIEVLKRMGVPHTFIDAGRVNEHLLTFFERTSENAEYPVEFGEKEFEQCELSHDIMLQIYYEDQEAFFEIATDSDVNAGIVLKNILGAYVPLSWDLFYSSKDELTEEDDDTNEDLNDHCEEHPDSDLESLHIDEKEYEESLLNNLEHCHEFIEVCEAADDYMLGVACETVDFYRWIWIYSQHEELIENILYFYTDDDGEREQVPESDVEFVLSVLACEDVADEGYLFDINLDAEECFDNAEILNKISKQFPDIYCSVISDLEWFDVSDCLPQIIAAVKSVPDIQRIAADPIWDHVYLVDDEPDYYDDVYVRCKAGDEYEDILLLWKSSDDDSYIRALAKYVSEQYHTEVYVACAESFDWKTEYLKLAKGIREFITETRPIVKESEVYGHIANMADVPTFYDERKLWQKLHEQREKIVCQTVGKSPINLEYWRSFLASKYNGRCQVCGNKTATGAQNAHFFTYRINKESENRLANLSSNMFCVCPSCHGEMQYGSYMGKNMNEILEKANLYWEYYDSKCDGEEMEDDYESLVADLADDSGELEGFNKPITCDVIVNGKSRKMAFSWEHFIMLAFVLKDSLQLDSKDKKEY